MGFWSSLASFGSDLIPGVGPLIGAGIGALVGSPGKPAGSLPTQINPAGNDTLNTAKSYFSGALNGDRNTMTGLLNPQISTVLDQYDNAAKTAANLGPRGGGRTAVLANAPFQKAAAYGQALSGATAGAGKELATIGEEQNQEGEAQVNANLSQNRLSQGAYQFGQGQFNQLGQGIGGMLTNIINGQKVNRGGSTSSPASTGVTTPINNGNGPGDSAADGG